MAKNEFPIQNKKRNQKILQLIVILFISFLCILALMMNALQLDTALRRDAENYAVNTFEQLASNIYIHFEAYQESLQQIASFLLESTVSSNFLKACAYLSHFDGLILAGPNGVLCASGEVPPGFQSAVALDTVNYDGVVVTHWADDLYFSMPIQEDGQPVYLLVGILERATVQRFMQTAASIPNAICCIVDEQGYFAISPEEQEPFGQLKELVERGEISESALQHIHENMQQGIAGCLAFTTAENTKYVLVYSTATPNGWALLSIVPYHFIMGSAEPYTIRHFIIIGTTLLLFILCALSVIGAYKAGNDALQKAAFYDALTGGLNNAGFFIKAHTLLKSAVPSAYSMVYLNVKGFRMINENFGKMEGNRVIAYIHQVLEHHVKEDELFARSEADHFYLLLKENTQEAVRGRVDAIIHAINAFYSQVNIQYKFVMEAGAYLNVQPDIEISLMQERASLACKYQGVAGQCVFYDEHLSKKMRDEQLLDMHFHNSLKQHDFQVYLQPQIRLADGKLIGAEALVRWEHPTLGFLMPSAFIPWMEANGKICELDLYVFEQVCKLIQERLQAGKSRIPISLNLSRVHFRGVNFLRPFTEIKRRYGIPDGMIEFELTESFFIDSNHMELLRNTIEEMHAHGFVCSLDDFGIGYSSLAVLKDADVDAIKLDKSFFDDIAHQKTREIVKGLIMLTKNLAISLVAEGIDTQEKLDFLCSIQCDIVQGFIFSKPLPPSDFSIWEADREDNAIHTKRL